MVKVLGWGGKASFCVIPWNAGDVPDAKSGARGLAGNF